MFYFNLAGIEWRDKDQFILDMRCTYVPRLEEGV